MQFRGVLGGTAVALWEGMRRIAPLLLVLAGCYGAGAYPTSGVDIGDGNGGPEVDIGDGPVGGGDADSDADGDADVGGGDTGGGDTSGGVDPFLCASCSAQGQCGDAGNACLHNGATGEDFCAIACDRGSCPAGYYCQDLGGGFPLQCLPEGDSCQAGGGGGGDAGGGGVGGGGGGGGNPGDDVGNGQYEAELQHCVDKINEYRADHGLAPLRRAADVEQCATEGAQEDSQSGMAHGHFSNTGGCNGTCWAENEIPGWPLQGSLTQIIDDGLQMMMDEGPGGGHYENMMGDYTEVGCGLFVTGNDEVWGVQDFR